MPHGVKAAGRRLKWLHCSSIKINKWNPRHDASSSPYAKTTAQKATQVLRQSLPAEQMTDENAGGECALLNLNLSFEM